MFGHRITTALAAVAITLALLAGCSPGGSPAADEGPGDIRVWFMRDSVSQESIDRLTEQFAEQNPGSTLTVEVQEWEGIVAKLQTSLASPDQTPDVVEFGNTKVGTFATVGALSDVTDLYDELGGDSLIQSFIDAGTIEDQRYAYPLFAGVRVIYYRTDLFEAAGLEVPATLAELSEAAEAVQSEADGDTRAVKGLYLPAGDVHTLEGWLFTHGANYATQGEDGTWSGKLSSPESIAALQMLQGIWQTSALGTFDSVDARRSPWVPYNNGEVAMFSGLPNAETRLSEEMAPNTGVFALPPLEAGGQAHSFSGGSSLAIAANSRHPELARNAMRLIYGEEFQRALASEGGWIPGNTSYADALPAALAGASLQVEVARNSVLTPPAENWAIVEGDSVPADMFAAIAGGGSVAEIARSTDARIEQTLNAS